MNTTNTIKTASAQPENVQQFKLRFEARLKGAIGIHQTFTETVQAESKEAAVLKLYDKYDSVHFPRIVK